ncbi:uncharacterized protein TRAVEDRAFT_41788 [Trametes versicolor FP-101664 SS1]|uniref:uncharacterized protein n=1 Tax=Trametes versicolor (strain FP-101664) TaxID=717944 RepID=UPI0004621E90|nr:uncharacterized protein TRAVEDRAFT_41788 [Trametes versicolor FP-101664 SS1]EIW64373.1 hypothetical protein TRAVEDRAFT_41788 [Trametes versicolor FP-101664 SS1]
MFTTLVSLFLSVFGALRAAPLYYSRILTIGNTIWASLGDRTATIGTLPGITTSTPVFRLPPSHVVPTLPAGTSTQYFGASLALLLAVFTTTLVFSGIIWRLRALSLAPGDDDTPFMHAGGPEKIRHTVIDFSGATYHGTMITSDVELAGLFAGSADANTPFQHETPTAPSSCAASREDLEYLTLAESSETVSPPVAPTSVLPPPTTVNPTTVPVELAPAIEEHDGEWDTWTNHRRRRPPRVQAPPSARASRSRSLSVFATSRTSHRPISGRLAASPAPTSLAPSPRRSSIAAPSSTQTTARSVASQNRFSALEVFEVEE